MVDTQSGRVGPMTRAMLIKNTYEAEVRRGLDPIDRAQRLSADFGPT